MSNAFYGVIFGWPTASCSWVSLCFQWALGDFWDAARTTPIACVVATAALFFTPVGVGPWSLVAKTPAPVWSRDLCEARRTISPQTFAATSSTHRSARSCSGAVQHGRWFLLVPRQRWKCWSEPQVLINCGWNRDHEGWSSVIKVSVLLEREWE